MENLLSKSGTLLSAYYWLNMDSGIGKVLCLYAVFCIKLFFKNGGMISFTYYFADNVGGATI